MATSPEYLRLASSAARTLADTALDSLRDGVVVVDARHKHLPVVLANATARRCLTAESEADGLIESPLQRWLSAASALTIEDALAAPADPFSPTSRVLAWRFAEGEISVMTEIKPLVMAPEQRLVMLTFAATPEPGSKAAAHHLTERRSGGDSQGGGDRRLLALTEHARDIITVTGKDGNVLFVSAGVTNSLGYTAEERR